MGKDREYREFRKLLRRGIGTRTQKAFAEEISISKEYLNRMLNNREIPRPSANLLERMAAHMDTITERMLLESCGYTVRPIGERVKQCEKQLSDRLAELTDMSQGRLWKSVQDAVRTEVIPYLGENGGAVFGREDVCTEAEHWCAEAKMNISYKWGDGEHVCTSTADVYFSRTENGNIIFFGYKTGKTEIQTRKEAEIRKMEERLMEALFGDEGKVITTEFGYGFYYDGTPAGFADFLTAHQGAFCTTRERSDMLRRIIDDGMDPDSVFEGFETDKYGDGTGGAVAEILSRECGIYYYHYQNSRHEEGCSRPCIMTGDDGAVQSGIRKEKLLSDLHQAAAILQIPEFGHIYFTYPAESGEKLYDTKTFGYEFPDTDGK